MKDNEIDWEKRHDELLRLLDRFRSSDGAMTWSFPEVVQGFRYVAHILKKVCDASLTVTGPPSLHGDRMEEPPELHPFRI